MYNADRRSKEYIEGVHYFLKTAERHNQRGFMCCPCRDCKNDREYSSSGPIHLHLLQRGFMPNYICWTKHRERGVLEDEEEEEEEEDTIPVCAQYGLFADDVMGEAGFEENYALAQMLCDKEKDCENKKDRKKLERMLEDHKTLLYPNCK